MSFDHSYGFQIAIGLAVVSLPFFIYAILGRVSWKFFLSWTLTSVFATVAALLIKKVVDKNLDSKSKLIFSIIFGGLFMGIGIYLRSIPSRNMQKIGWLFIVFGILWLVLSF